MRMGLPFLWSIRRWAESSTEVIWLEAASALMRAMVKRFFIGWGRRPWRSIQFFSREVMDFWVLASASSR